MTDVHQITVRTSVFKHKECQPFLDVYGKAPSIPMRQVSNHFSISVTYVDFHAESLRATLEGDILPFARLCEQTWQDVHDKVSSLLLLVTPTSFKCLKTFTHSTGRLPRERSSTRARRNQATRSAPHLAETPFVVRTFLMKSETPTPRSPREFVQEHWISWQLHFGSFHPEVQLCKAFIPSL